MTLENLWPLAPPTTCEPINLRCKGMVLGIDSQARPQNAIQFVLSRDTDSNIQGWDRRRPTCLECQHKKACVMEVSTSPRQSVVVNARRLIAKLSRFKMVFPLSSAGYCAIHWLFVHNFSSHVFWGALVFGAMGAVAVACLSDFVRET